MKRHPDVRLDHVIGYSEPMEQPGYYFMDSPGNDLESIAGQVAAGCNMIFFVTGNGSITNFPFAPTIKFVTTSQRYRLLARDMDVNSGAYLDGTPMDELGQETFDLTVRVASGARSVGEQAGHAQAQIWRNWTQTSTANLETLLNAPQPTGSSIAIHTSDADQFDIEIPMIQTANGPVSDQVGLILPTSLCSGQVAAMIAKYLNEKRNDQSDGLSRFVSLAHTEGCGVSSGQSEELATRTMVGYILHPLVKHCLLLEHGCEKTHNDHMRNALEDSDFDLDNLGWASIQLDGGIDAVTKKIDDWFARRLADAPVNPKKMAGIGALRIGLMSDGPVSDGVARSLAQLTKAVVGAGGTIVSPENAGYLSSALYREALLPTQTVMPSLAYGEHAASTGFHIMETPTSHWVETLSGIGATGVELVLAYVGQHTVQTHPLVPVLQVTADEGMEANFGDDLDLVLEGNEEDWARQMLQLAADLIAGKVQPKLVQQGNIDFQITRGFLGVSL